MHRTLSVAALAAVLFVPAMAQPASITVSASAPTGSGLYQQKAVSVQVADADLGTAQGAAALLDRINAASRVVCGERAGQTMNTARAKLFAACQARTVTAAVQAVNAPALTQLAAAR
jgi:UrcA family protein